MNIFPLQIFPEGSLSASVTTTVWIGLWVVTFFNLRLGWTASGFVVPGYVAPLLLLRPASAGVIIVESIITYLLVYWASESFHCRKPWSSLFGRDRFLALVLASILVRITMDTWLLPELVATLHQHYGIQLRFEQSLHSYGLIIVSLLANCLWKPGLVKGLTTNGITIGLTYLIIRFGLMELTNFSVGNLQYLYEDIASSLLASPKAYIVLITSAFIASWMNLRYGWDFNGILIPALLALQWYDPTKILVSAAESILVLIIAIGIMKLPGFRRMTIEGSRKTLLFFNVTFGYRLLLGYVVPWVLPDAKPTDFFGLGYLLSTLLAMKAHQNGAILRLFRATIQVSAIGTISGTLIGFALLSVSLGFTTPDSVDSRDTLTAPTSDFEDTEAGFIRHQQQRLYASRKPNTYKKPTYQELEYFDAGLRALKRSLLSKDQPSTDRHTSEARRLLAQANFALVDLDGRYWGIHEALEAKGRGFFLIDRTAKTNLLVQVPVPLDEWSTVESGWCLFQKLGARALSIGGTTRSNLPNGQADVLSIWPSTQSCFQNVFDDNGILQVRGYSQQRLKSLQLASVDSPAVHSRLLWIKNSVPDGLNLAALENLIGPFGVEWSNNPLDNELRDASRGSFAELSLDRFSRRRLLSQLTSADGSFVTIHHSEKSIQEFMLPLKSYIAGRDSNGYQPPTLEELLFCDEQILKPLITLTRDARFQSASREKRESILQPIALAATAINYKITSLHDENALLLSEDFNNTDRPRHWGALLFGIGQRSPMLVTVVRPEAERDTYEYGVELFVHERAQVAFFAGTHPHANQDGSSDLVATRNRRSLLSLTQQVLQREFADEALISIQTRAFAGDVDADILVANHLGSRNFPSLPQQTRQLVSRLIQSGLRISYVDGRPSVSGYELSGAFLASSAGSSVNHEFVTLWLSLGTRSRLHSQQDNRLQHAIFHALDVPTEHVSVLDWARQNGPARNSATQSEPPDAIVLLCRFLQTNDINALQRIRQLAPDWNWVRLLDPTTGRSYLAISDEAGPAIVARLAVVRQTEIPVDFVSAIHEQSIAEFLRSGADVLARSDLQ